MQLTKHTDFAFRVLLHLGRLPAGERSSVAALSDHYGLSANHLAKVVVRLSQLGYVDAARGKGGGITLTERALNATAADIVRAFEPKLTLVDCNSPACGLLPDCRLRGALAQAMQAFMRQLATYTLADLLTGNSEQVLRLPTTESSPIS